MFKHARFRRMDTDVARRRKFWDILRVPEEIASECAVLGLCVEDANLLVSEEFVGEVGVLTRVANTLLGVFHFRKFAENRHAGLGCVLVGLVASWAVGLDSIITDILANDEFGDWYLQGYRQRSTAVRFPAHICF